MKVLVIPDVHLKKHMFEQADEIMTRGIADRAVCLMDIPDDWNKQYDLEAYAETFDAAISFAVKYPDTLWCWGNHDLSYWWGEIQSGFSSLALWTVREKINEFLKVLPEENSINYVQRIDNVIFSHGGLCQYFADSYVSEYLQRDIDGTLEVINRLRRQEMWHDESPIWYRPQYSKGKMYKPRKLLQVVGHTPRERIERAGNVVSCDVFSTYRDGSPIGTEVFPLIDTLTWDIAGIRP